MNILRWETNLKNGICFLEFDRKDVKLNKLAATTLESKIHVFDVATYHSETGFAEVSEVAHNSTVWGARFLPQNRDLFCTLGGDGSMNMYKYNYPSTRVVRDDNGAEQGVAGTLGVLNKKEITTQPIVGFDWHPDKSGLACMAALDQSVKVFIVTRLNLY